MNSPNPAPLQANLGPIIGKVTHNNARILVEFNRPQEEVSCFLQSRSHKTNPQTKTSLANKPIVFTFDNLEPETLYKVHLSCPMKVKKSSLKTLRENTKDPGNLKAAIVSCNEISRHKAKVQAKKDLWRCLKDLVETNQLDYVFHIGDQIYMDMTGNKDEDTPYEEFCKTLNQPRKSYNEEELLEILRAQSRRTWCEPSVAEVLANVPNLMICDDHEFRDDWGFKENDYTEGTVDHLYGKLARQVYYEYQRQLREDIDWNDLASLKCEYHHHILNGVGVSFMEYRGCRSWFREENLKETHIGRDQKAWIQDLYREGGEFEQVNSAIFITPLPLFLFPKFISKLAYLKSDDIQEHWTYNSVAQLEEMLDLLRKWKKRGTKKEILVVGGDFHLGGWTDVMYKKEKVFTQFISSAINSEVASKYEKTVVDALMNLGKLTKVYQFKHSGWIKENNFGLVEISREDEISEIEASLGVSRGDNIFQLLPENK